MSPQKKHWMVTLQEVFYPALAVVGIPSNTITFLIIWRRSCMLSRSSTFYLMAMSVADNLVLIFIVILELSVKYHQQEPFWSYDPWCSLRDIFNYGAYNASTWLVVMFTVERFIAIHTWKMKTKICTPRCAAWTITAVFLFSHLCAIPYYWSNASVYVNNQTRCIYKTEAPFQFIHTLVWFQTLQAYIIPFLVILTLNGLTLRLISLSNRVHITADLTSRVNKVMPLLRSRKRKSVVLLVTVSMSFMLLSVTRAITQIILRTTHMYTFDRNDYYHQINIAADTGTMLSLSNAAVNMYLYVCTQSKFRQEFLACVRQVSFYWKAKL
ncbi:probable G-protein coupled receptor 139 [Seriola lalandi dorsalis]|uniref:probable G-protein coupled receptor 139 n=1 Tax=Seriola lalandi dorsalis TaxID=1841481 RepID=UPI000C6F9EE6|nr:probable G-protein coupled receptor 139 [Seriola lalandi dorsalis]XP_056241150.1 probable G-protein coupled receptor 139 [Seriola aureovittata]